jgi:hypothetical protein
MTQDFNYTGGIQTFTAPLSGIYKIELWGAQGGGNTSGGKGAYTSGNITLSEGENIYVYVGNKPSITDATYNGGGLGNNPHYPTYAGGGATDVRLNNGNWDNLTSLRSRIMVAAGSGGFEGYAGGTQGGPGGGLVGYDGSYTGHPSTATSISKGATQTAGGAGDI